MLYLDEDHVEILNDGNVFAVRQNGKVQVWCELGEFFYGYLPENATEHDVRNAVRFFDAGMEHGKKIGAADALSRVRSAIGL